MIVLSGLPHSIRRGRTYGACLATTPLSPSHAVGYYVTSGDLARCINTGPRQQDTMQNHLNLSASTLLHPVVCTLPIRIVFDQA